MKKPIILLLGVLFATAACGPRAERETTRESLLDNPAEQAFLDKLASLCNQSFGGYQVYMQEGRDSWEDFTLIMHVDHCEEGRVHIPLHLDEDHSRTWMFMAEDGRLRFRHDHRYPDGTPEERTMYGGYADGTGNAFEQHFPADEYTIELLTDTLNRRWSVALDEQMSIFSYRLLYHGEIVFQADFDLTNPL